MNVELIAHKHPKSGAAEAYRVVRTNLGFAAPDNPARVIMVTSAAPEEGKTTTVCNLGIVLAQAGHSVCLVDCDLRRPRLHRVFGYENGAGLTNFLSQKKQLDETIVETEIDRLSLLPSGPIPPNPAEMLGSKRTAELWPLLAARFDYALVDSPPVLAVTDASILAGQVDGVILVTKSAKSRVDLVREAKAQLTKAGARFLGVVLNETRLSSKDYGYYYYYRSRDKGEQQVGV